jgi:Ca2+/H+ antiporter
LAFLVALVLSLFNLTLMGKPGTTVWRGVIALVAFAISLLQLQATTSKP